MRVICSVLYYLGDHKAEAGMTIYDQCWG